MSMLRRFLGAALLMAASTASAQTSFTYSSRGCFGAACAVSGASALTTSTATSSTTTLSFTGRNAMTVGPTNANGFVALSDLGRFTFASAWVPDIDLIRFGVTTPVSFTLWLDFTAPAVLGAPVSFTASLSGSILQNTDRGTLDVDFDPNSVTLSYAAGTGLQPFQLFVDDRATLNMEQAYRWSGYNRDLGQAGDWYQGTTGLTLTGAIDCSPEQNGKTWTPSAQAGVSCSEVRPPEPPVVNQRMPQPPTVSTVPEPSTYALMLAGLAGMGLAARRRRTR